MSTGEAEKFEEALLLDDELMDTFQKFSTVKKVVDATPVLKEPPARAVDRILDYSRTYDLAATQ